MKAVIMAGGSGTRLRPLTCNTPKPMTEIATEPAMLHIIRLLKMCGVEEAAVTTMYLPEKTEAVGSTAEGVRLTYFREESPLGTAGSVKRASKDFEEDFIVISGDCICDFDLKKAMEYHREKNSVCTLVLADRADPSEYGTVLCDKNGQIVRFIEKPAWSQVFSGKVNTGIYIISPEVMSLVPDNTFYDFAKDLFPRLLSEKMYGYAADGYWCDIGSLSEYFRCNFDAAEGKVTGISKIPLSCGESIVHPEAEVSENAHLNRCIVHKGAVIESGVTAENAIICSGARISENTVMGKGAIAGEGCVIGKNSVISPGVRIFPGSELPDGSAVTRDVVKSEGAAEMFLEKGICGSLKGNMSPERCFALGAGCVPACGSAVGVMSAKGDGAVGEMVRSCIINGITHGGGIAYDFGEGNRLMSAFAAPAYGMDVMLYVHLSGDDGVCISPVGSDSLSLCGESERKIRSALNGSDALRGECFEKPVKITGVKELYTASLLRSAVKAEGLRCAVSDTPEGEVLGEALKKLGADVIMCASDKFSRETRLGRLCFDVNGESLSFHMEGLYADFEHIRALLLDFCGEGMNEIALPYSAPLTLERIARVHNVKILRYLSTPTGKGDAAARKAASGEGQLIFRDGCFAAVRLCGIFAKMSFDENKIRSAFAKLPMFCCLLREVEYSGSNRAAVMEKLVSDPSPDTEGARIEFDGGSALIIPSRAGGFRIIAEALSAEAAQEISLMAERKIYGKEK